ncbi:MAG TPA: endonuclease/exonuclease/phosphatase family protein [Jatrophihabitans sp.]
MTTLRLLSYNIRSLRDDEAAVIRVIRAADPHVVCIQEAPRFLRWRSTAARIARKSGLVVVTGGRTAAANLMLSRLEVTVDATRDVLLSKDRRLHQRGIALARLQLAGAGFAVGGVHLDVLEAPRLRHVAEIHAAVDDFVPPELPMILAGDMNDDPGSPLWQALESHGNSRWVDAWAAAPTGDGFTTSSQRTPLRRIDAVFVDPRLRVARTSVINSADVEIASDHRPVLAEIELPDSAPA